MIMLLLLCTRGNFDVDQWGMRRVCKVSCWSSGCKQYLREYKNYRNYCGVSIQAWGSVSMTGLRWLAACTF